MPLRKSPVSSGKLILLFSIKKVSAVKVFFATHHDRSISLLTSDPFPPPKPGGLQGGMGAAWVPAHLGTD